MARLQTATRAIRNRPRGKNLIGVFPSLLTGGTAVFESNSEKLMFLNFEYMNIGPYVPQPLTLSMLFNDKVVTYTPDASAPEADGSICLYQAKPLDLTRRKSFIDRMTQYEPQLLRMGYSHRIFSPENYCDAYWINLTALYASAKLYNTDTTGQAKVRSWLMHREPTSLVDAARLLRAIGVRLGCLYTLMFRREIIFDVEQEISKATIISCRP